MRFGMSALSICASPNWPSLPGYFLLAPSFEDQTVFIEGIAEAASRLRWYVPCQSGEAGHCAGMCFCGPCSERGTAMPADVRRTIAGSSSRCVQRDSRGKV